MKMSDSCLCQKLKDSYLRFYGNEPTVIAAAPGRLEILGNHTDYNEGFVLSTATDLKTIIAITPVEGSICKLHSFDNDWTAEFDLNSLETPKPGCWSNYIKGVVYELSKIDNTKIKAFNAGIISSIPLSAGMSSSAALEISAGYALGKLFGIELSKEEWAKLGQRVENNYMGLQSGLLDQFSSAFGEKNKLIFSDFREVKVKQTVHIPEDYAFVVANTMVKHNLVDSDYNERRESCEAAVETIKTKYPKVKKLRDVTSEMLKDCKSILNIMHYRRALHIVGEDERVIKGIDFLNSDEIEKFGQLMFESHQSSIDNFENSCPELDYYIELAKTIPGCVGARLSGGGFGGISIHIVEKAKAEQYSQRLLAAFKLQTGIEDATVLTCEAGEGAKILLG
jgi:galactokinase